MKYLKRTLALLALLATGLTTNGQTVDTAAQIVDHYVELLGNDRWPADSLLVMTTVITSPGSTDTFVMKRWFMPPQMQRVEVRLGKTLQTGFCSNGKDIFRMYRYRWRQWRDTSSLAYYENFIGYDFRGPLYNWRAQGAELTYKGLSSVLGHNEMKSVKVVVPRQYARYYFFEPSGLMSVVVETDEISEEPPHKVPHTEWKFIHEYLPVGNSLLPSKESFMRDGKLTVMETTAHFEPADHTIFSK